MGWSMIFESFIRCCEGRICFRLSREKDSVDCGLWGVFPMKLLDMFLALRMRRLYVVSYLRCVNILSPKGASDRAQGRKARCTWYSTNHWARAGVGVQEMLVDYMDYRVWGTVLEWKESMSSFRKRARAFSRVGFLRTARLREQL
jgi:hypothetical protein